MLPIVKDTQIYIYIYIYINIHIYSFLPNRRVARSKRGRGKDDPFLISVVPRNKRGGGKVEPFLISVVPGIGMEVRIFRPVTVIKRRTK